MIKVFAKEMDVEVPAKLRGLVVAFILGETERKIQGRVPVFPTGFPLIVNVFGSLPDMTVNGKVFQTRSRSVLAGQMINAKIHSDFNGRVGQIGIILHPTAPFYLFHKCGDKLINMWTPLNKISPIPLNGLEKKLKEKTLSKDDRISQLLTFLKLLEQKRLPQIDWLECAIQQIYKQNGNIDQRDLLENSGVGSRHFRRVFRKIIGVPPKYFCKVVQMNTAFEAINKKDPQKLHHIALDCGYYDQAHFINDFSKMFGESPEKFLNGKDSYIKQFMGRRGT